MLTKTIEFEDYDGNMRKETYYFGLNKAEVIKWMATDGDYTLDKVLERIYTERNGKKIVETFEDIIHRSYGRKSVDGKKFEKSEEIWNDFYQTEAYSALFMELLTDAKKAAEFMNGILPKSLSDEIAKTLKENPEQLPEEIREQASKIFETGSMPVA